jgi:hypothetical protein
LQPVNQRLSTHSQVRKRRAADIQRIDPESVCQHAQGSRHSRENGRQETGRGSLDNLKREAKQVVPLEQVRGGQDAACDVGQVDAHKAVHGSRVASDADDGGR